MILLFVFMFCVESNIAISKDMSNDTFDTNKNNYFVYNGASYNGNILYFDFQRLNDGQYINDISNTSCSAIKAFYYNGTNILCIGLWAGNFYDIWLLSETQELSATSFKMNYTGVSLLELFRPLPDKLKSYINNMYPKKDSIGRFININDINVKVKNGIIILTIKYKYIASNSNYKRTFYINIDNTIKDTDGDNLSDLFEDRIGTDKRNKDTDGDGIPDGYDNNPFYAEKRSVDCGQYNEIYNRERAYIENNFGIVAVIFDNNINCQIDTKKVIIINSRKVTMNYYAYLKFNSISNINNIQVIELTSYYAPLFAMKVRYTMQYKNNIWKIVEEKVIWEG